MKEIKDIQEQDFRELCQYMGKERALEFLKKEKYNYRAVVTKLLLLRIGDYSRRNPIAFWVIITFIVLFLAYNIFDIIFY